MEKKRIYIRLVALPDEPRDAAEAYGDLMANAIELAPISNVQFFNGNIISDVTFKKHLRKTANMEEVTACHLLVGDRVTHRGFLSGDQVIARVPGIVTHIEETDDRIISYTVDFQEAGKKGTFGPQEMREDVYSAFTTLSQQTLVNAPHLRWSITAWNGVDVHNWQSIIDTLAPHTDDTIYLCGNQHQITLIQEIVREREKYNLCYL